MNTEQKIKGIADNLLAIHNIVGKKYVFIRIPKTGTGSMNVSLWNTLPQVRSASNQWVSPKRPWWDHYSAEFCIEHLGRKSWDESITFTIVRNPFSRLYSIWKYEETANEKIGFKEWVLSDTPFVWDKPHHPTVFPPIPALSQKNWITDSDGKIATNLIFRLEEIDSVGVSLLNKVFGRFVMYPAKINKTSEPNDYMNHYDSEMIDFVESRCGDDLSLFHYDFDGVRNPGWFHWDRS